MQGAKIFTGLKFQGEYLKIRPIIFTCTLFPNSRAHLANKLLTDLNILDIFKYCFI